MEETAQKTIVVALGGNALQKNNEAGAEAQQQVARETARQLVPLINTGHRLVIVHGNGPQVGDILLQQEAQGASMPPASPLDTCVAMSQGEIGYWLQQALQNELAAQDIEKNVATIVTQVVVDKTDKAFQDPSKPVGPFYPDQATAEAAAQRLGFVVKEDAGRGWRRVVPSPVPLDILEKGVIQDALKAGSIVIAAGGGGIPVYKQDTGFVGVAAVIDKDHSAEKLAELIEADTLLILMDLDAVSINFRQPDEMTLGAVTAQEMQRYADGGQFAPGSMLPKVQAAIAFTHSWPGSTAIITSVAKAHEAISGQVGTHVSAE